MNKDVRCKVRKTQNGFDRACDLGYGINLYGCKKDEMWLIMPMDKASMKFYLEKDGFEMLTEVITNEEYFQVRN
ncbi:hypothetical protein [Salmonella phage SSBI34]|nr:hypothetical protein [Salmonella phage SSBI34]